VAELTRSSNNPGAICTGKTEYRQGEIVKNRAKYYAKFEDDEASTVPSSKLKEALKFAIEVRKFEIDLYWRRAAYFWAFAAVALGGYLAVTSGKGVENREEVQLIVCCVGLVFSWAWYLVNRASKYWQLNWEHHVDLLEDNHMGPIYKTVLHYSPRLLDIAGPLRISTSKINQLLSLFVFGVFAILLITTLWSSFVMSPDFELLPTLILPATGLSLWGLVSLSKQDEKDRANLQMRERTVDFVETVTAVQTEDLTHSG
jgi:hypothetical protein